MREEYQNTYDMLQTPFGGSPWFIEALDPFGRKPTIPNIKEHNVDYLQTTNIIEQKPELLIVPETHINETETSFPMIRWK